jgi:uncharacterized protein YneF (UPF0154 family)
MIEFSIGELVYIFGAFFLSGMGLGIFAMIKVVKKELKNWDKETA